MHLGNNYMFSKNNIQKLLKTNKKKRIKELADNLDNILFLDFDGVINLDENNYSGLFNNSELINNLSSFCLIYNFKIVVISSWRKYSNYKDILYNSGLDRKVEIIGATDNLEKDRESEVIKYLKEHCYINKFIILDDRPFDKLKKYQIQTKYEEGFNNEKYDEAIELINKDLW